MFFGLAVSIVWFAFVMKSWPTVLILLLSSFVAVFSVILNRLLLLFPFIALMCHVSLSCSFSFNFMQMNFSILQLLGRVWLIYFSLNISLNLSLSVNQSINPQIHQLIDQSINQSINQSFKIKQSSGHFF